MNIEQQKDNYLKEMSIIAQAEQLKDLCQKTINAVMKQNPDYSEARYNLHMVSRGVVFPIEELDKLRGLA